MRFGTRHQHRYLEMLVGGLALLFSMSGILLFVHQEILPWFVHGETANIATAKAAVSFSPIVLWLYCLHTHLLMGTVGAILASLSGVAIATVSTLGMLRWTGWKRFKLGFMIRCQSSDRILNFDLHNTSGFFAFFFLLTSGLSGGFLGTAKFWAHSNSGLMIGETQRYQTLLQRLHTLHTGHYSASPALLILYFVGNLLILLVAWSGIRVGLRKKDRQLMHYPCSLMMRLKRHAIGWL